MTTAPEPAWAPRPVLALGVRAVQYGLPLLAGTLTARVVSAALADLARWWVVVAAALVGAVTVSLLTSRLTLRLAPLALMLQMTMVFPDHAPTRLRVARRSTSAVDIAAQLRSPDQDAHEAAVTVLALVTALGRHDKHTRGHSERVRILCDLLSREMGLNEHDRGRLRWAAIVHDIGKLDVAVEVLTKPGALDEDEWAAVRAHPAAGALLAAPLAAWLGPWYAGIVEHHERFDGSGYPHGLCGTGISPAGRAIAVVDAFETMTASRSYKAARSVVAARAELTRCAGTHFDPAVVRAFLRIALPRLLWSVGPLALVLNGPFLRWVGDGGNRLVDLAGTSATTAVNAAGVTAAVVVAGTLPTAAAADHTHAPRTVAHASAHTAPSAVLGYRAPSSATTPIPRRTGSVTTAPSPDPSPAPSPAPGLAAPSVAVGAGATTALAHGPAAPVPAMVTPGTSAAPTPGPARRPQEPRSTPAPRGTATPKAARGHKAPKPSKPPKPPTTSGPSKPPKPPKTSEPSKPPKPPTTSEPSKPLRTSQPLKPPTTSEPARPPKAPGHP